MNHLPEGHVGNKQFYKHGPELHFTIVKIAANIFTYNIIIYVVKKSNKITKNQKCKIDNQKLQKSPQQIVFWLKKGIFLAMNYMYAGVHSTNIIRNQVYEHLIWRSMRSFC